MSMFINRVDEKRTLDEIFASEKAELVLVYGRRRVGKSRLLMESIKRKNALYLLADMSENILEVLASQVKDEFVRFLTWDDFFDFITRSRYDIIVIDEFQYLYNVNKAWPTILQRWWEKMKSGRKKIILCGSTISTIYRIAMGYGSALYGRKTREIEVFPLGFRDFRKFFSYGAEDALKAYFILGGIPRYMEEFDPSDSIETNIRRKIIDKTSFLYNEPVNLLFEEFRDFTPYTSILLAISEGRTKFNEISDYSRISGNKLPKYLGVLERVKIIGKDIPVTERRTKSKTTRYFINDNFYRFWFRFIFRNKSRVEQGMNAEVFNDVKKEMNAYFGKLFEEVCRENLANFGFKFDRSGRWWHKDKEIDIVATSDEKEILLGECKWKENVNAESIARDLARKAGMVDWNRGARRETLAVFAKSFSREIKKFEGRKVHCIDLRDFGRL
ncbi:MAG: ATP-binding protein [Candidatus Aenigmarchaeota archaeon]|nr:ATP-binding protein [Candidatus Aenigmarchaeota archaeon]